MKRQAFLRLPDFTGYENSSDALLVGDTEQDLALTVDQAMAQGFEAGRNEGLAELGFKLAQAKEAHVIQLEQEREWWVETVASQLAKGFDQVQREASSRIRDECARVLEPMLKNFLRREAEAALQDAVLKVVNVGSRVSISAPRQLCGRLEKCLSERGISAQYTNSDTPDVTVSIDDTEIRSVFDDWYAAFAVEES